MRILVDIDDVLFPWFHNAHTLCEEAGITNGITPSQWECWLDYGCTMDTWLQVMEAGTLDGRLYGGDPYPGAVNALQALHDAGHSLHLVTARGFFAHGDLIRAHTVEWLATNAIPHDSLTFSKDKTFARVDVAIDDSVKNVVALEAAGVPTCLMDAPHNRKHSHRWRVTSVVHFAQQLLEDAA